MVIAYTMLVQLHYAVVKNLAFAVHLHCLTSIELFVNASFYASHPIFGQHNKGALSCPSNTIAMCLSDIALNALQKDDPSTAVIGEEAFIQLIISGVPFYVCFHYPVS
jgi:hypothetical protein